MRWFAFSNYKYYLSAGVALVGLSAASTLLTDRVSLAQQPQTEVEVKVDVETQAAIKAVAEALGADHPKVKELRKRLESSQDQVRSARDARNAAAKAKDAAAKAEEAYRRVIVQNVSGNPVTVTDIATTDGDVVTEEIQGNRAVVVRRKGDGTVQEFAAPAGGIFLQDSARLALLKHNSELQKAIEKLKAKVSSDADKAAAKEKIIEILGKQFDEDMEQRDKQIAELEKKVVTLKDQIAKRKDAKQRLIDLRMELLMNESEGLGFPSSWQQSTGISTAGIDLYPPTTFRAFEVPGAPIPPLGLLPPAAPAPAPAPAAPDSAK